MANAMRISEITFTAARQEDIERGLLGWVSFTVDGNLRLDGVAIRRTVDSRYVLSFPARRDGSRRRHFFVRPLDDHARCEIERQVLGALGFLEEAPH
jgi:hypothetical protein